VQIRGRGRGKRLGIVKGEGTAMGFTGRLADREEKCADPGRVSSDTLKGQS
jgi:hypothetical protein